MPGCPGASAGRTLAERNLTDRANPGAATMNVLSDESNYAVARHPIFRIDGDVFGYELLYRSLGSGNVANLPSDEEATLAVLANGIHAVSQDIGPDNRIFINFSKEVLEKGYYRFLDRQRFVIEVLETVACDAALVERIRSIRDAGYVLALDDYVGDPAFDPILPFVEYVKIDFLALRQEPARLRRVIDAVGAAGKTVLAEKVETEADIMLCRARGIPLAQGYYYCRPQVVTTKIPDANQAIRLNLLAEVSRPEININKIRDIIGSDVSLTYKLLRYVNTARFYRGQVIESLDFALKLLGRNALASWVSVNLLASLGSSPKDREMAYASAVRGRFLALVDGQRGNRCHAGVAICLLGLLSLLDAILGVPMETALQNITLDADLRQALLGRASPCRSCLILCQSFEGTASREAVAVLGTFGVAPDAASRAYFQALSWASEMFRG